MAKHKKLLSGINTMSSRLKMRESQLKRFVPVTSEEELFDLYCRQGLSTQSIGDIYKCSRSTIINLLRRYKIPVRKRSWVGRYTIPLSLEDIISKYLKQRMSLRQIAASCHCASGTIRLRLKQAGIELRGKDWVSTKARRAQSLGLAEWHKQHDISGEKNPYWGRHHSEETKQKLRKVRASQVFSPEMIKKRGKSLKRAWDSYTPEERNKRVRLSRANCKPNKPELLLLNLLESVFPNEWAYVGDGKLMIEGMNPDFTNVNGQKKIIEMYGDYWHRNDDPEDRRNLFAKYGYDTLVVWERELKDLDKVLQKIREFAKHGV